MTDVSTLEPIPYPPRKGPLGNLLDINSDTPIQGFVDLARQYGPIFEIELPGRRQVLVSSFDLVDELSDDQRFDKFVGPPLQSRRASAGDGLFTAWTHEPNWHKAHNILLPNFSQQTMQGYLPMMLDIAEQLLEKWARLNPNDPVNVPEDMTRLTLDTIALCGFSYRFNSFYREEPHPYVAAMTRSLRESLDQVGRLPIQNRLMVRAHRQFQEDISSMNNLVDKVIQERKRSGSEVKDLLGYMLNGVDKESGEKLDDLNIRYQCMTFLTAGHETTSGLLSFATYYLLQHPEVVRQAYEEVDRVLGSDLSVRPSYEQVNQLRYITQILKESLRLWPTAPLFSRYPYEETVIGQKYRIPKGQEVVVVVPMLHRDKSIWGENAEKFDPENFSREAERTRPANAYKPFGTGQRACIGRQFALQEAALVLGMILQRFELIDHTNYQLKIKEALTLKPDDFWIKVRPRQNRTVVTPAPKPEAKVAEAAPVPALAGHHNTPLLVLYGSNLGTAEILAHQIGDDGATQGFATTVAPLDDYPEKLLTQGAVVIVTASYNGTPPDNAAKFCHWLQSDGLAATALQGVNFTVFGCGNRDWAATYQAVPHLIDAQLEAHGAKRIYSRGEGDARDDFDGQFRAWYGPLWSALGSALSIATTGPETVVKGHRYEVEWAEAAPAHPFAATYGTQMLTILQNRELQRKDGAHPSERSTRHLEIALPEGMTYRTGDHLGVLARNSPALIQRVAIRFNFNPDSLIRIRANTTGKTHLPTGEPIKAADLLAGHVELQEVATRAQIQVLAEYTECPPEKAKLEALAGDDPDSVARYREQVLSKRLSLLDLLEMYPACSLPFNIYLELLQPLRPRYYSISSSPLAQPHQCSLTVGVVNAPARSGRGVYEGVCSNYLNQQGEGTLISGFVRDPNSPFRLPADPKTPLIMVGPGTGLASFRGFLQERATLQMQGQPIGPSLLFFGCRHPEQDFIYEEELRAFEQQGVTRLEVACSRVDGQPKTYVQELIRKCQDEVWQLIEAGAVIYICGDASKMAPDVRAVFGSIYRAKTGGGEAEAEAWLTELSAQQRYLTDVWASS
jgi:cytochrome P450/NADPH-cytochrome P450 reductase